MVAVSQIAKGDREKPTMRKLGRGSRIDGGNLKRENLFDQANLGYAAQLNCHSVMTVMPGMMAPHLWI